MAAQDRDGFGAPGRPKDLAVVGFEPEKELRVIDQPVFGDFGIAGAELAVGKGIEGGKVGKDEAGLVEGAHEVFAEIGIDAGLAPDR